MQTWGVVIDPSGDHIGGGMVNQKGMRIFTIRQEVR